MLRKVTLALSLGVFAISLPLAAEGQQAARIYHLGYLGIGTASEGLRNLDVFRITIFGVQTAGGRQKKAQNESYGLRHDSLLNKLRYERFHFMLTNWQFAIGYYARSR